MPLFRLQAMEYAGGRVYGSVLLAQPMSYRVLTVLFAAIAFSIIAFFAFFSTTRKAHSNGVLLPTAGVIRVLPGQTGVLIEKHVREGQTVKAGDLMFVLSNERSSVHEESAEQTISVLLQSRRASFDTELRQSVEQARQRISAVTRRADDMELEIARIDEQIKLQQLRVGLAEQAFDRFKVLEQTRYISAAQLQDKQGELLDQRQRLADLQRTRSARERELAAGHAELQDMRLQAQRETEVLQRNVFATQQDLTENEARRKTLVRAPQDGIVTAIAAELGQTVVANVALASMLPVDAELEAEIYMPSRAVGFVKHGMDVLVRYQAYPYQKFGQYRAQVREISNTSLRRDELAMLGSAIPSAALAEPVYRIRLRLERQTVRAYGQQVPLKAGMLVDASILLEHRRLYEWVLEPLYSITGRI